MPKSRNLTLLSLGLHHLFRRIPPCARQTTGGVRYCWSKNDQELMTTAQLTVRGCRRPDHLQASRTRTIETEE